MRALSLTLLTMVLGNEDSHGPAVIRESQDMVVVDESDADSGYGSEEEFQASDSPIVLSSVAMTIVNGFL